MKTYRNKDEYLTDKLVELYDKIEESCRIIKDLYHRTELYEKENMQDFRIELFNAIASKITIFPKARNDILNAIRETDLEEQFNQKINRYYTIE